MLTFSHKLAAVKGTQAEDLNKDPLKRCCPFCGKTASLEKLYTSEFEVEHLIPYSASFDDGRANKVISCRNCNRIKRKRTPYEAFGHCPDGYQWVEILARAENLHEHTRERFAKDPFAKSKKRDSDMIARMLNDTRYMSRVAREYLACVVPENKI